MPVAVGCFLSGLKTLPGQGGPEAWQLRALADEVHSFLWLFPRSATNASAADAVHLWPADAPMVRTPSAVYTMRNLSQALRDIGYLGRADDLAPLLTEPDLGTAAGDFAAPGVDTYIIYGHGVGTPEVLVYGHDFNGNPLLPPKLPTYENVSGDMLVPERSSLRSVIWEAAQAASGHRVLHRGFAGQSHCACVKGMQPCFGELAALLVNGTLPASL